MSPRAASDTEDEDGREPPPRAAKGGCEDIMEILQKLRIKTVEHPSRGLLNAEPLEQRECS